MTLRIKFLILGIICALGAMSAHAQSSYELKRGYTGSVELIVGIPDIGINTTHGYRLNQYWSFGLNTGVNMGGGGPYMPLRPTVQLSAPLGRHGSLFLNCKYGLAISLEEDRDELNRVGWSFCFGPGIRYRRMTFQLAVDGEGLDYVSSAYPEVERGFGSVQFRLGYTFGAR